MEIYYDNPRVKRFVEEITILPGAYATQALELLAERGNNLKMPYSKALSRGLFELRITDMMQIRIFYAFHGGGVWLLHGFIKKQQQTPKRELEYARKALRGLV